MGDTPALDQLAQKAGVETGYYDFRGEHRTVPASSCRHILAAMGFDDRDAESQSAAILGLEDDSWQRLIPPVCIVRENGKRAVPLRMTERQLETRLHWRLWYEDGRLLTGHLQPDTLGQAGQRDIQGTRYVCCESPLPADLGPGYHELVIHAPGRSEGWTCRIIVVPARCYEPPAITGGENAWGIAVQLYSLRSGRNWGIGDFGDLKRLAWKAGRAGAQAIGLNPLHAAFPAHPEAYSPYRPSSRSFLNVLYIDVPGVPEAPGCAALEQLVRDPAFRAQIEYLRDADRIDYAAVTEVKLAALRLLYEDFRSNHLRQATARAREFQQFVTEAGPPLETHALFDALHAHFARRNGGSAGWHDWPADYQDPCSDVVMRFALRHRDVIDFYQYLQWIADAQLAEAHAAALDAGMTIGLYRDLAVGVSPDGSETWANQRLYIADATVGAPPDALALRGQDWGLPPLHPKRLEQQSYAEFVHLIRNNMRDCGALRIDHVMGLLRLWWVPSGADATEGAYVYYPFEDLLGIVALESQRARCLVIGEDLGTVPEQIRDVLPASGVYSYRVLMFEKDQAGTFAEPHAYPRRAVATASTHDLPPLYSFWDGSDIRLRQQLSLYPDEQTANHTVAGRSRDRASIVQALRQQGLAVNETDNMNTELMCAIHAFLARSRAAMVMCQPEDWLGMTEAVNIPGTTSSTYHNWRRKLSQDIDSMLEHPAAQQLFTVLNEERSQTSAQPAA
ncbi:MAG: 4-alpha-glucanotransferase [Gammaproteobacteria bacterium]|nr:4-alpha-glucanotransferase [Gammaproteobacteria bacterium]NNF61851.1 4-alpha-glucanotransferase [Gammaproteobacteria bacterium]